MPHSGPPPSPAALLPSLIPNGHARAMSLSTRTRPITTRFSPWLNPRSLTLARTPRTA